MVTLPVLDEVTQDLLQDQNLFRIKKLMIYACHSVWEVEPQRVDQYALPLLIQTLVQRAPAFDDLKAHLAELVKTLNKPAEYTLVANAIVNRLRKFYPESANFLGTQPYGAIVAALAQDPDHLRIKKLLLCACTHSWENNPQRLSSIRLFDLVQELHELAPTQDNLWAVLISIVKTINRKAHYQLVAEKIRVAMEPLYALHLDETLVLPESVRAAVVSIAPVEAAMPSGSLSEKLAELPVASRPLDRLLDCPSDLSDLFDLRLEIMKYTNPLRAKLLLFSALYQPLNFQDQSWLVLKTRELDDLLYELFRSSDTITALESRLNQVARSLPEPSECLQAAAAIVRTMKAYAFPSAAQANPIAGNASTTVRELTATVRELTAIVVPQDDATQQLSSPPAASRSDDEATRQI
jgi:hypothetical protein